MNRQVNRLLAEIRRGLREEETSPLKQGELRRGMELPFGSPRSSMVFRVVDVTTTRASLARTAPLGVDVGPKLAGKGSKMVLQWDGTGYGRKKYKGAYGGGVKIYARADGIY